MDRARLRINLAQREIEIEGSEAFVAHWAERRHELLAGAGARDAPFPEESTPGPAPPSEPLEPFGQFVQLLPNSATEVDRMLAAGYWLQRQSPDDAFSTGEASRLLAEHGIKIGNPSQAVRQSLLANEFLVHKGRYRVGLPGRQYLARLGAVS